MGKARTMSKYKLKTHKGTHKRMVVSGSGRLLRGKGLQSHLRRKKPKAVRRLYDDTLPVHKADTSRMKRLLPYGA